jgi:signal recognition particle subunit SRP19
MMKVKHCIEPFKKYPRDQIHLGRVRIQLRDPETKEFLNEKYKNKEEVMVQLAALIPKLKKRVSELQEEFAINNLPRHKRKKALEEKKGKG